MSTPAIELVCSWLEECRGDTMVLSAKELEDLLHHLLAQQRHYHAAMDLLMWTADNEHQRSQRHHPDPTD